LGLDVGSAYVFKRSGNDWYWQSKLVAGDREADDGFGSAVAVSGGTIVVGAPIQDFVGVNSGCAYVFFQDGANWIRQAKLIGRETAPLDLFGTTVSIHQDEILIGAPSHSTEQGWAAGAAFVFKRTGNTWIEEAKLSAKDGSFFGQFGTSLVIENDTALVGAHSASAAYVFRRVNSVWGQEAKLVPLQPELNHVFGYSVALSENNAVIGTSMIGTGNDSIAYLFSRVGGVWTQRSVFSPEDGDVDDPYQQSVALSGKTAVVGVSTEDGSLTGNIDVGSIYIFDVSFRDGFE
jgi:FG-GAP repeat